VAKCGQGVIHEEAGVELPQRNARAAVDRPGESQRTYEVRRNEHERSSLATRLEHEVQMPMLEVAHAAVHEPRRATGRSTREVVALDERRSEPAHRRLAGDTGAVDSAADHEHVEV